MIEKIEPIIASAVQTFLATFFTTLGPLIANGVSWTWAFWIGVASAAAKAALKAVFSKTNIPMLGGKR